MRTISTLLLMMMMSTFGLAQQVQVLPLDHNTSDDDVAPSITGHGRVLVVTRDEGGEGQRLFRMERSSGGWTSPGELGGDVNDAVHAGAASLTPDGQFMVFSAYDHDAGGNGRTDIYSARLIDGKWKNVMNLGSGVNSTAYDAQPSISADGRTIYFSSDRPGGKGGTDIYVSTFDGTTWSAARPLDGINTAANETAPVINADGTTFTFASNRAGGSGGLDIYTARITNGAATGIKNAGTMINTAADEAFYVSVPNSDQAFFSRTTERGDYDNFSVVPNPFPSDPVTLVEGTVKDAETGKPLAADITITDVATGKKVGDLRSDDQTGQYFVTLAAGRVYAVTASAPGYVFHSDRYEVPPGSKGSTVNQDIALRPLNGSGDGNGDRLLVFFDFDKSELKSESFSELERVIELLRTNTAVKVQFEGHTDDQGTDAYNNTLSEKRAQAVQTYVTAAGIAPARVSAKGFGKTQPLMQGSSEEARAKNRRVEMRLVR